MGARTLPWQARAHGRAPVFRNTARILAGGLGGLPPSGGSGG
ncbi:hypothetical protein SAMN04244550_03014, partial [Rhodobacter capsulatus]